VLDLSNFPMLDVVIGLAFVYFLLSIVISALTESVSAVFQLRFRTLQRGIRELIVEGDVDKKTLRALNRALEAVPSGYEAAYTIARRAGLLSEDEQEQLTQQFGHDGSTDPEAAKAALEKLLESHQLSVWHRFETSPRMRALWKQTGIVSRIPGLAKRGPSYVPPRVFALTLLDTLAPPEEGHGHDVVKQAEAAAEEVENPLLRKWLNDALVEAEGEREKLLASIETSFDGVMNRVSGWYKRWATIWVVVFAALLAGVLNADSYAIGQRLWKEQAVRNAVATQAGKLTTAACPSGTTGQDGKLTLEGATSCVDDLTALDLPLGWSDETTPGWSVTGVGGKAVGLVITVFALMMGAPFWFDTLSKLARLRTTGKPESPAKPA
jgi:hypothetical protein